MTTFHETQRTALLPAAAIVQFYVHLNTGEVRTVGPATCMRLTGDEVVILDGEACVAHFPRREVYFCSEEPGPPPMLT